MSLYGKILLDDFVEKPQRRVVNMRIDPILKELFAKFSDGTEKQITGVVTPPEWGDILGDIANQTDLNNALSSAAALQGLQDTLNTGATATLLNGLYQTEWNLEAGNFSKMWKRTKTDSPDFLAEQEFQGSTLYEHYVDSSFFHEGIFYRGANIFQARIDDYFLERKGTISNIGNGFKISSGYVYNDNVDAHIISSEYNPTTPSSTKFLVKDSLNNKGLEYDADYSLNFIDRSLVDKGYVVGKTETGQTYTLTNVAVNRTFDANTVTLADLADVVGTLINDLKLIKTVL